MYPRMYTGISVAVKSSRLFFPLQSGQLGHDRIFVLQSGISHVKLERLQQGMIIQTKLYVKL